MVAIIDAAVMDAKRTGGEEIIQRLVGADFRIDSLDRGGHGDGIV